MRVGADEGLRRDHYLVAYLPPGDDLAQIFKVDLMDDAVTGRDNTQSLDRLLCPFEEGEALAVSFVFVL